MKYDKDSVISKILENKEDKKEEKKVFRRRAYNYN
jgi:hypothetical protein